MAELKTTPNDRDVYAFIDSVEPDWKREDSRELLNLFGKIMGTSPVMWGDSIVGYGSYHYKYKSGREGDWFLSGFSPRKQSITIYLMGGSDGADELFERLGKYKKSVGCVYINKLADVNIEVLEQLITHSVNSLKEMYEVE